MKTITAPMKKHLKMTTAELIAEREKEVANIAHSTARLETTTGKIDAVVKGWITGSRKAIDSIDMALAEKEKGVA